MAKARDVYILENWDGSGTAIMVPNGDLKLAEVIVSPYTILDGLGLDAAGVIELLRTYEKIPTYPVN
jgi:hypothetical protein